MIIEPLPEPLPIEQVDTNLLMLLETLTLQMNDMTNLLNEIKSLYIVGKSTEILYENIPHLPEI